jgi:hypothetical protein
MFTHCRGHNRMKPASSSIPKRPVSVRLDAQLAAEFRAFVRDEMGAPLYLTVASFIDGALRAHLIAMRRVRDEAHATMVRERGLPARPIR